MHFFWIKNVLLNKEGSNVDGGGAYLWAGEVAEPRVGALDRGLLHDPVARLAVGHVVRTEAVLSVEHPSATIDTQQAFPNN